MQAQRLGSEEPPPVEGEASGDATPIYPALPRSASGLMARELHRAARLVA